MNKIKFVLVTIIVLFVFVFVYYFTYSFVEPKAYDFMTKQVLTKKLPIDKNKKVYGSDDIVIIIIDDKTVEKYRWPWKRDKYCKIFNYLNDYANPKVIVHDAIIATLDNDNPSSDKKFFQSVSKTENLIVGFLLTYNDWEDAKKGELYETQFLKKFGLNITDKSSNNKYYIYASSMPYPKPYFDIVKYAGAVNVMTGFVSGNINFYAKDEIYRNNEFIFRYKQSFLPSLSMATFLYLNDKTNPVITNSKIIFPELNRVIPQKATQERFITPMRYYKLYPTGYSHITYHAVDIMDSYDAILEGKKPLINPQEFKDKIVVIGANVSTGTGANDIKNTPMRKDHAGVDMQASAIDNLINNDFLTIIPSYINVLITLLGMLFVYCLIRIYDLFKSISYTFVLILLYIILCCICYYFYTIINVITPVVMFVITMILGYIHKFILENQSKEKVKNAMGKYMSQDVMKRVVMNIDNLGLGGKKANVTVLFSDIRGFTSMSENMSAQQVSEILNEYFTEMEPIITKYNGIINKFIGDAVMAVFGEPIQDKNHAANAVKCGYEMLLKVKELQKKWSIEGKPKIEIGIGINTGEVFVGNIGSNNRMEYTVIGDTVNLASRLEGYNKIYKTKMLISSSTYEETKTIIDIIKISDVAIRGKAQKMDIYEVLKVNI